MIFAGRRQGRLPSLLQREHLNKFNTGGKMEEKGLTYRTETFSDKSRPLRFCPDAHIFPRCTSLPSISSSARYMFFGQFTTHFKKSIINYAGIERLPYFEQSRKIKMCMGRRQERSQHRKHAQDHLLNEVNRCFKVPQQKSYLIG